MPLVTIPCLICGRGALVAGCEAAMIFQSTYGVSVTFRVTPTWVKCMFWRTSPMADRHPSLQEDKRRKDLYMFDSNRLDALEIMAMPLMKVAIMDCDAL